MTEKITKTDEEWKKEYEVDLKNSTIRHKKNKSIIDMEERVNQCFTEHFIK